MQIIAIAGQKGGTGKTTTTINLADGLHKAGHKVLVIDLDPQHSCTRGLGIVPEAGDNIAAAIMGGKPLSNVLYEYRPGWDIAPAHLELAEAEIAIQAKMGRENKLKQAIAALPADTYDMILIDCPPALGLLHINALSAAGGVLVPMRPEINDIRAFSGYMGTIAEVQQNINPALQFLGIVITHHNPRAIHHQQAIALLTQQGHRMAAATIGSTVALAEATTAGQPIADYAPDNKRSAEYADLTSEVLAWLKRSQK